MRQAPRPEAEAGLGERPVSIRLQHLHHRLLDERSSTVGMPSGRVPPEAFGISTRRTGRGL
jgi:hypothetical protein